jgi:hypothetical protein
MGTLQRMRVLVVEDEKKLRIIDKKFINKIIKQISAGKKELFIVNDKT